MGVLIQLVYTNRKSEELNQRVYLFNQTIKYVFSKFLPNETVISDDWDPHGINSGVKVLMQEKDIAK